MQNPSLRPGAGRGRGAPQHWETSGLFIDPLPEGIPREQRCESGINMNVTSAAFSECWNLRQEIYISLSFHNTTASMIYTSPILQVNKPFLQAYWETTVIESQWHTAMSMYFSPRHLWVGCVVQLTSAGLSWAWFRAVEWVQASSKCLLFFWGQQATGACLHEWDQNTQLQICHSDIRVIANQQMQEVVCPPLFLSKSRI